MSFYCQSNIEDNEKCEIQCNHCKEYYKPLEEMISKQQVIDEIEQRIKDEHRKHPTLEWERLSAIKIYRILFDDDSNMLFHECEYCNWRCNCNNQPCSCCLNGEL